MLSSAIAVFKSKYLVSI